MLFYVLLLWIWHIELDVGVAISPQEIVGLFVQRGMYDIAQSAASSLKVDMTDLFQSLASRCVELSRLQEHAG